MGILKKLKERKQIKRRIKETRLEMSKIYMEILAGLRNSVLLHSKISKLLSGGSIQEIKENMEEYRALYEKIQKLAHSHDRRRSELFMLLNGVLVGGENV